MARGTLVTIGLALAGIAIAVGLGVAAAYLTTPSVGISTSHPRSPRSWWSPTQALVRDAETR